MSKRCDGLIEDPNGPILEIQVFVEGRFSGGSAAADGGLILLAKSLYATDAEPQAAPAVTIKTVRLRERTEAEWAEAWEVTP